ncbi:MAG: potassium channel family protein [Candidatus Altiarchaeota archaeon]
MKERLQSYYVRIGFRDILVAWLAVVVVFGFTYYLVGFAGGVLVSGGVAQNTQGLAGFYASVYFSFITATSLGYGDITPVGVSRVIAIVESVVSLLIFGIVISKLVSIKQEVILEEVYGINFQENYDRINRKLMDFRVQNMRLQRKIRDEAMGREEALDVLDANLMSLDATMSRVRRLLSRGENYEFVLTLDDASIEVLLANIESSLVRLEETIRLLGGVGVEFKAGFLEKRLSSIVGSSENICLICIPKKVSDAVVERNERVVEAGQRVRALIESK